MSMDIQCMSIQILQEPPTQRQVTAQMQILQCYMQETKKGAFINLDSEALNAHNRWKSLKLYNG